MVNVSDITKLPKNIVKVEGVPPNMRATLAPITLINIPVEMPVGNLGGVTWPLTPGDTGVVRVCDRSIQTWLLAGIPTDPYLAATHMLADGIFVPGLKADTQPLVPPVDATATHLRGALVKLGTTAALSVTVAETLISVIDTAIAAAVSAAAAVTPPAGDGGTAAFTALQASWNAAKATIASATVKVQA